MLRRLSVDAGGRDAPFVVRDSVQAPYTPRESPVGRHSAAIDDETSILPRPFAAIGCKSYFNDRVFVRSELLTAVGPAGYSHLTIRVGVGVDF